MNTIVISTIFSRFSKARVHAIDWGPHPALEHHRCPHLFAGGDRPPALMEHFGTQLLQWPILQGERCIHGCPLNSHWLINRGV